MATAEQRAALVGWMARAIASAQRCEVTMQPRQQDLRAADAALVAVEAAGWRPPSAPLTADDRHVLWARVMERMGDGVSAASVGYVALEVVSDLLRHPLLAARGVRLEGEQR